MNNTWTFSNGLTVQECTSFPYAFRSMMNEVKRNQEKGINNIRSFRIVSPIKDAHGDPRSYSYDEACKMASSQGLLLSDGTLNSKEFKRPKF